MAPLELASGGTNLLATQWSTIQPPGGGNQLRRVEIVDDQFVYADSGQALDPQPINQPPVAPGNPIFEASGGAVTNQLGTVQFAGTPSAPSTGHRFTALFLPARVRRNLPPNAVRLDNQTNAAARWVANTEWVPSYIAGKPMQTAQTLGLQNLTLFTTPNVGEARWLMAAESLVDTTFATYPLPPGESGSPEIARLTDIPGTRSSTFSFTFSLPELPSFSAWRLPDLNSVPIAKI